jgi:RNA polymerase sigma-70 factor (ECF subfamily)
MSLSDRSRTEWLARNVLPHEALIRSRLNRLYVADLDVDDIIQEMYARILRAPALDAIRYPKQYAIQTAKGIVINYLRRSRVVSIEASENLEKLDVEMPEANAEERLGFRDEILEVASILAQLPEVCRETFILRRIEGLSQKETAQRLGVTEKVVESQLARCVLALVKLLGRGGKHKARLSNNQVEQAIANDETEKRRD